MTNHELLVMNLKVIHDQNLFIEKLLENLLLDNWMSIDEAVEESGLTENQIRYAARSGAIRVDKTQPRKTLFRASQCLTADRILVLQDCINMSCPEA